MILDYVQKEIRQRTIKNHCSYDTRILTVRLQNFIKPKKAIFHLQFKFFGSFSTLLSDKI